ncbi:putative eukaryotic translation initiation factor 5A-3-like [Capsicum annuum]|uniref:isopentenyl phosphate kinase isoform X1 n=1 Tax=Capsicum annuum TaxID=4072 RepID=UPI0007BFB348|nr:isopentenyl phosphate kinase isoform X1 [Capsicum annuum]KAF3655382.1 putative eukaryotic translation initiation factor 5A-3-like [Capsicum annuum]
MEQKETCFAKRVRCIVKLGGAAITSKHKLETIDEENLKEVSSHLRQAFVPDSTSANVLGMDWSRRPGQSEAPSFIDDFSDQPAGDSESFIVVHGAGSFGHFQASKSGVHKGGLSRPLVKAGFVATRISVTSLNLEIVRALAREGIPSIGMSPFSCGWSTCQRNMTKADISMVIKAIDYGFIPVLHGDAVLDTLQECTILSGDVIIRHLAAELKPEFVVFLTDVLGVYDRPPAEPGAVLIQEIAVREDGSWSVVKPKLEDTSKPVEFTVAAHDTTGGMVTKITEAAMIAKLGIDVYITKAATDHSVKALSGILKGGIPDDWLGTAIRYMS